jgi:uncharacterized protein with HEPN domain
MSPLDVRKRDLVKCEDMRLHAERARQFVGSRSLEEFQSDELVQDAVIRCVEVIGEAARQVSDATRVSAPAVPWAQIVGMRNLLVHDYGGVDLEQVYRVITESVPPLIRDLERLLEELEREVGWGSEGDPPGCG